LSSIGIDRIVAAAGVAKMTLYRHFRSKDELVLAVLDDREELWTRRWLEAEVRRRGQTPSERLLAIFDAYHEWFQRDDYEGCFFLNTLVEIHDRENPVRRATLDKLLVVRRLIRSLAEEAGVRDPDAFAVQWQILTTGSIVVAMMGDAEAGRRARDTAAALLQQETS
jgi:AcrR family transcriptional regulator